MSRITCARRPRSKVPSNGHAIDGGWATKPICSVLPRRFFNGIVKNHAFEQGNKRTATVAALMFIEANGYEWNLPDEGELAAWVLELLEDRISEDAFAEKIRPHVR